MACNVVLTHAAEEDEEAIVCYLTQVLNNPEAATHFLDNLEAAIHTIELFPESYPLVHDTKLARSGYRKAHVLDYLAIYRIDESTAYIVRIFHMQQDYVRHL